MKEFRRLCRLLPAVMMMLPALIPLAEARKIKTKHSITRLSAKQLAEEEKARFTVISKTTDSVDFASRIRHAISFYGFDKTVTSNAESFFISNGLDSTVYLLDVRITYTDMKGRQLHRRDVRIDCEIAPHETMRTDIKSWDTQKSFYFHRSVKPKRQATPFDVRIELLSVTL